jgi:phenylacetate-CoA ligase
LFYKIINNDLIEIKISKYKRGIYVMNDYQFDLIKQMFTKLSITDGFYKKKFEGIDLSKIQNQSDFEKLPFTTKGDLRDAYPLGLQAVPDEEILRIHSSSGTTGTPVIIPYTKQDIDDWALMFKRCYETAGVTNMDRVHITPGYGLWTAGIGFQAGAELLGAMAVPMGPGNTDKQIKMMIDLKSTVLCATSSYALLLAEEITKLGVKDKIHLKKALIGSERWGEKMRHRIANELGVELYDIYGLTEIYGPGIGISCSCENGMHYWDDYLYFEIINPHTGEVLPKGEMGELVITTLRKEGAPLIRYRTHDLTRILNGECKCGLKYPRIATLVGRTDDMVKVKGVNIFPGQIDEVLRDVDGVSSEYQVMIDHLNGKDILTLLFETENTANKNLVEINLKAEFKSKIGITIVPKAVSIGELPRSEKKSTRIFDNRY